jgi:aspartate/methionine/tyrosine aminotransferase
MRHDIRTLPGSKIREVANAGLGRPDVLAFWFGESDEVTPGAVREAAQASLRAGETFYAHNLGLPELREAIAHYASGLHGPLAPERVAVTSSGVTALMLACQMLAGPGDEVAAITPVWPNLTAQPLILGAQVRRVPLRAREGTWSLDLDALHEAVTPRTRMLLVNAPNNPTGWTLTADEQRALLAHCRRTGTWIVADEVYERLWFGPGPAAPSFLDVADPEDRLVVIQSFSKSFLMTGWRLGWMVLPQEGPGSVHAGCLEALGKLAEFNTSCTPVFVQRGGLAALAQADAIVPGIREHMRGCRDRLVDGLQRLPRVQVARPAGGMYAFFRVEGEPDSLALAKALVARHGLGLAPGAAFGPEGEGWLRWCFASRDPARLDAGMARLADALA